jgi:hypothetical protein
MNEPRLRGNTFIALLLRTGVQELSEKPEWGEHNNGITRPNLFADLLRMTQPAYNPPKMKSLSSYFSRYLKGELPSSPMYFAFNTPAYQKGLSMRIHDEYPAVLAEMDRFYRKYLRTSDVDRRMLVGGLVDAILADSTFEGTFDIGEKWVDKTDLAHEHQFILQPFLVSVWNNILLNHPDASEGADTYMEWTDEIADNKPRETTTKIGTERAKKIAVDDRLPEEAMPNTAEEEIAEAEEVHDEPRVDIYEASYTDPQTQKQVLAQFHVEAKDNGIAIGQVFGGLVIGKRGGKDE